MTRQVVWGLLASFVAGCLAVGYVVLMAISFDAGDSLYGALGHAFGAVALVLGWLVLRHQPRSTVGTILCFMGLTPIFMTFTDTYLAMLERVPGSLPVSDPIRAMATGWWMWLYVPPALLLLVFPTGRLLTPRWRVVWWGLFAIPAAFLVVAGAASTSSRPDGRPSAQVGAPPGVVVIVGTVLLIALLALLVAASCSLVLRYRRSLDVTERHQIKWLLLAGLTVPGTLMLCWMSYLVLGTFDLVMLGLASIWLSLPVATWVAINRHDLYDIDRLTSAAVGYGVIATALLAVATATSLVSGVILGAGNNLATAAVTLAVAVALSAVRPRLSRRIDRLLYPARARVLAAVDELYADVHAARAEPEDLPGVLQRSLDEPELRIVADPPPQSSLGARPARTGLQPGTTLVRIGDHVIAQLSGYRHTSRGLMEEIADAVAPLVELSCLRQDLRAALRETEAAQRRVNVAAAGERRRLERDLHDGAQQRLVALGLAIRVAQRRLGPDSTVDDLLETAVAELGTAVSELRELAHGIRPIGLDGGLAAALAGQVANSPIPVTMRVSSAAGLSDEVATAAYFIVSEALANATKHSEGTRITVEVSRDGPGLSVRVSDNGRGDADPTGSGLSGLADRVRAMGGNFRLSSPPSGGTLVEAVLPCAS